MRGATGSTLKPHQILLQPKKKHSNINGTSRSQSACHLDDEFVASVLDANNEVFPRRKDFNFFFCLCCMAQRVVVRAVDLLSAKTKCGVANLLETFFQVQQQVRKQTKKHQPHCSLPESAEVGEGSLFLGRFDQGLVGNAESTSTVRRGRHRLFHRLEDASNLRKREDLTLGVHEWIFFFGQCCARHNDSGSHEDMLNWSSVDNSIAQIGQWTKRKQQQNKQKPPQQPSPNQQKLTNL